MDDDVGPDMNWIDAPETECVRVPLEHARVLDRVCSPLPAGSPVYLVTDSPALARVVADRHDHVLTPKHIAAQVRTPPGHQLEAIADDAADHAAVPDDVTTVIVGEPESAQRVRNVLDAIGTDARYEVLVGNRYSWNQFEDRTLAGSTCSPAAVRRQFADRGFETESVGYHGPQSILWSAIGRLWKLLGRPDRRDVSTYRMRESLREEMQPLALLSCLVRVTARRRRDDRPR